MICYRFVCKDLPLNLVTAYALISMWCVFDFESFRCAPIGGSCWLKMETYSKKISWYYLYKLDFPKYQTKISSKIFHLFYQSNKTVSASFHYPIHRYQVNDFGFTFQLCFNNLTNQLYGRSLNLKRD